MRTITIVINVEDEQADEVFEWVESRMFDVEVMPGVVTADICEEPTDEGDAEEARAFRVEAYGND